MFDFLVRGVSRNRSRFSIGGNKARDRRAWAEAAEQYRKHLLLAPQDAAIWIQLGHMLKEAGHRDQALQAYDSALALTPDDNDLLLHLGHLLHAQGDFDRGKGHLRASAAAGNLQAREDLMQLFGENPAFEPAGDPAASPELLAALSAEAEGLRATDYLDIKALPDNRFEMLSFDPWVVFEWENGARPTAPYALLTVETDVGDQEAALVGQVYVDIGEGFNERQTARFSVSQKALIVLVEPDRIKRLRLDPTQNAAVISGLRITVTPLADAEAVEALIREQDRPDDQADRMRDLLGLSERDRGAKIKLRPRSPVVALDAEVGGFDLGHDYEYWMSFNADPTTKDYQRMAEMDRAFRIRPTFSFVMPTYNTPVPLLRECIDSLLAQTYADFEICIADDNSPDRAVVETLEEYASRYPQVKFIARKHNGHISAASNSAISLATGDFIVLVDHDDLIPDYTLFVLAHHINLTPDADILFSDEDKITETGERLHPYFKGCFNEYLMYGHNMVSHLGVYRRSLVEKAGGFRLGLEGSQDYDLLLRCYKMTTPERIVHIPHVLYHWRIIPGSTAMSADQKGYAVVAAQSAINGHFERENMPFRSIEGFAPGCTGIRPSRQFDTSVSIIIPTRNGLDVLRPCVESVLARDHENSEIIIVDNGSDDPATLAFLARIARQDDVRVIVDPDEFNFSRINNRAAAEARGEILCFLNNDTEVLSADWLNRARALLSMEDVGMVGSRLLFPDGTLQHFGIVLGMGDHRIAGVPYLGMDASYPGYFGKARLLQEVSAVTAACMFLRKRDFEAAGGFEEALRVAYNDIDLCLKVRAFGKKILVDPDITLTHKESRTRGSDEHGARAKRLKEEAGWMRRRWARELDNDPYYSPNIDLDRVDFAYAARSRQPWPWEIDARA